MGYSPRGRKESDLTERLEHTSIVYICQSQSPSLLSSPFLASIDLFSVSVSLFLLCK